MLALPAGRQGCFSIQTFVPIAQWIVRRPPKPETEVQLLVGTGVWEDIYA